MAKSDTVQGMKRKQKRHDWLTLKSDYIKGVEPDVTAFLRAKGINAEMGSARRHTAKWAQERHEAGIAGVGAAKLELSARLAKLDDEVKEDAMKLYRSLPGLLSRTLRMRGMPKEQRQVEQMEIVETAKKVLKNELPREAMNALQELPANLDMFAFESLVRALRLMLNKPTTIEKGDYEHRVNSIADLVSRLGYAATTGKARIYG